MSRRTRCAHNTPRNCQSHALHVLARTMHFVAFDTMVLQVHGLVNDTLPSTFNNQGGGGGRTVPRANRCFARGALRAQHRQALGRVCVCRVLLANVTFTLPDMGLVRPHGARALVPLVPRLDRLQLSAPHRDHRRRRCAERAVRRVSTPTHPP